MQLAATVCPHTNQVWEQWLRTLDASKPDLLGASSKEDAEHQKLMQGIRGSSWSWLAAGRALSEAEGGGGGEKRET